MPALLEVPFMLFIGVTSFVGQVLYGRSFQLEPPSRLAAVNYLQVGCGPPGSPLAGFETSFSDWLFKTDCLLREV